MDPFRRRPSGEILIEPSSARSESRLRAEPPATKTSGAYVTRYGQIRAVLLRYLSPILVDSVLDRAMHARNLSPEFLSESALAEVTADIMVGLRLFVPGERLSQLMLELAETLDSVHP
jgi:hypothetical protein